MQFNRCRVCETRLALDAAGDVSCPICGPVTEAQMSMFGLCYWTQKEDYIALMRARFVADREATAAAAKENSQIPVVPALATTDSVSVLSDSFSSVYSEAAAGAETLPDIASSGSTISLEVDYDDEDECERDEDWATLTDEQARATVPNAARLDTQPAVAGKSVAAPTDPHHISLAPPQLVASADGAENTFAQLTTPPLAQPPVERGTEQLFVGHPQQAPPQAQGSEQTRQGSMHLDLQGRGYELQQGLPLPPPPPAQQLEYVHGVERPQQDHIVLPQQGLQEGMLLPPPHLLAVSPVQMCGVELTQQGMHHHHSQVLHGGQFGVALPLQGQGQPGLPPLPPLAPTVRVVEQQGLPHPTPGLQCRAELPQGQPGLPPPPPPPLALTTADYQAQLAHQNTWQQGSISELSNLVRTLLALSQQQARDISQLQESLNRIEANQKHTATSAQEKEVVQVQAQATIAPTKKTVQFSALAPTYAEKAAEAIEPSTEQTAPVMTLLASTSLGRDIDAEKLCNTEVMSLSGGLYADLSSQLADKKPASYARVCVLGGGNNCEQQDIHDILTEFKCLATEAKRVATNEVLVASIPPRKTEDQQLMAKIKQVNAELLASCDDLGLRFVNLDQVFYLQDGSVNDGYLLADLTHLTARASAKVVDLFELSKLPGTESAVTPQLRSRHQPASPGGTTHLRRNKDDGWQTVQGRGNKRRPQRPNFIYAADHSKPRPTLSGASFGSHHQAGQTMIQRNRRQQQHQQQQQRDNNPQGRPRFWQNFRGGATDQEEVKECARCLGSSHSTDECRSRNKICHLCGRIGHLERACDWY